MKWSTIKKILQILAALVTMLFGTAAVQSDTISALFDSEPESAEVVSINNIPRYETHHVNCHPLFRYAA